ncbi:MAG: epimerase [Gemmatimonadota bacterium]
MKIVLFGATGMIGEAVLIECLEDDSVETVLAVVRRPTGHGHPKLLELIHRDFLDYSGVEGRLAGYDACLYCLGVSSFGMSEADYRCITLDFTVAAAEVLLGLNPGMRVCFVSGAGAGAAGRAMWARVKAEAEQALLAMPWRSAHMFRPAFVMPRKGVVSRVRAYRVLYALVGWAYPILGMLVPDRVTTSDHLARAMIRVARDGHPRNVLEGSDINAVGG